MKLNVDCPTLRDVVRAVGLPVGDLATRLGLSVSMVSLRMSGARPWFEDELGPVAAAINETNRAKIDEAKVLRLIGKANVKRRGYLAA